MIEFYCNNDSPNNQCPFRKEETQLAGPSMGARVCDFSGSCESQRDATHLFYERLMRLGELSYEQLCAMKQESIHRHRFMGLGEIEKALIPHMKKQGF